MGIHSDNEPTKALRDDPAASTPLPQAPVEETPPPARSKVRDKMPEPKVAVGSASANLAIIVSWVVKTALGVELPSEVALAFGGTVFFFAAYYTPQDLY